MLSFYSAFVIYNCNHEEINDFVNCNHEGFQYFVNCKAMVLNIKLYIMECAIFYFFGYIIIGLIVGLINIKRIEPSVKSEWLVYSLGLWPIYVPCLFLEIIENAIEFITKQINRF